ncbi:MAG: 3-dehydroquinate synthase [Alphaproteobacteria bacterium]|jgi:3-dehydroquinate synthase|nr:3-dehydroquinate synthase [Alphaproteobacteria bacterium]
MSQVSETTRTIRVDLGDRSYDIAIGPDLLDQAGALIAERLGERHVVIITDSNVGPLYAERLEESLAKAGHTGRTIQIEAGEQSKSFIYLESLLDDLLSEGLERGTVLLALGGGVIGDLTGFTASIALRGIEFVQIPTTLLAQVDSSVGGKTAINSPHGKNLIGTFYQPRVVIADTSTLTTLPPRELGAGYAETVKYGLLGDAEFFEWLEQDGTGVLSGNAGIQTRAIVRACEMKAEIVNQDERETGRRALLNLGHTFAHALEAETGFGGTLLHGEAVAIGMVLAFDLSVTLGLCPAEDAARVRAHFEAVGLPTTLPSHPSDKWDAQTLIEHMSRDKKVQAGRTTFVLVRGIGDSFLTNEVGHADLVQLLDNMAATA